MEIKKIAKGWISVVDDGVWIDFIIFGDGKIFYAIDVECEGCFLGFKNMYRGWLK